MADEMITVTVRREDAMAVALGPLDYTVAVMEGKAPDAGSPMRLRQELARALAESA